MIFAHGDACVEYVTMLSSAVVARVGGGDAAADDAEFQGFRGAAGRAFRGAARVQ